jgi:hypothetical protein
MLRLFLMESAPTSTHQEKSASVENTTNPEDVRVRAVHRLINKTVCLVSPYRRREGENAIQHYLRCEGVQPLLSYNLHTIESELTPAQTSELLREVPVGPAVAQERFDLTAAVARRPNTSYQKILRDWAVQNPSSLENPDSYLHSLIRDGRFRTAADFIEMCDTIFGSERIAAGTRKELADVREKSDGQFIPQEFLIAPEGTQSASAPAEILNFYIDDSLRAALKLIKSARDFASRAPTSLLFDIQRIEENMHTRLKELSTRLKRYLISAITKELIHQHENGLPYLLPELTCTEIDHGINYRLFIETLVDVEDVLNFLKIAHERFASGYNNELVTGGKAWAKIAENTYSLWIGTESSLPELIDHIFQLEHNTATVLDKNPAEFKFTLFCEEVLDAKSKAVNLTNLIEQTKGSPAQAYKGQESFINERLESARQILNIAQNYFPTETTRAEQQLGFNS